MVSLFPPLTAVPDPPINVQVIDSNDLEVTVEWTPGADGNSPITEYSVEYKTEYDDLGWMTGETVAASTTSETLTLKADNTYNFRVKAKNKVGTSSASEMSPGHTTPEKPPAMNPTDVTGTGPEPGVMVVSWEVSRHCFVCLFFNPMSSYLLIGQNEYSIINISQKATSLPFKIAFNFLTIRCIIIVII